MSTFTVGDTKYYLRRETAYSYLPNGVVNTKVTDFVNGPGALPGKTVSKTDPTRRRKPIGWLYPLPFTMTKANYTNPHGSLREEVYEKAGLGRLLFVNEYSGAFGGDALTVSSVSPYLSVIDNTIIDRATVKALLKLKNQSVNLGVALAESQQLANMVGTNAIRVAKAYTSLRHGQWKKAMRALGISSKKQQPGNWLELQYGWKPLLSDIHGAVTALKTRDAVGDRVVTVKASVREKTKTESDIITGAWSYRSKCADERGVFIRLDYIPTGDFTHHLAQLGVTNPLEIAWEVVPYSFVVDWFLPVGNWLSILDATVGYDFLSGSCTRRRKADYSFTGLATTKIDSSYRRVYSYSDWSAAANRKEVIRTVYPSSPMPTLRFKSPLSLGHMANGLSLLSQAFSHR